MQNRADMKQSRQLQGHGQVLSKKISAISKRQGLWPMLDVSALEAPMAVQGLCFLLRIARSLNWPAS